MPEQFLHGLELIEVQEDIPLIFTNKGFPPNPSPVINHSPSEAYLVDGNSKDVLSEITEIRTKPRQDPIPKVVEKEIDLPKPRKDPAPKVTEKEVDLLRSRQDSAPKATEKEVDLPRSRQDPAPKVTEKEVDLPKPRQDPIPQVTKKEIPENENSLAGSSNYLHQAKENIEKIQAELERIDSQLSFIKSQEIIREKEGIIRIATEEQISAAEKENVAINPFQLKQSFLSRPAYVFIASDYGDKKIEECKYDTSFLKIRYARQELKRIPLTNRVRDQYDMVKESYIELPCTGYFHLHVEGSFIEKTPSNTLFGWGLVGDLTGQAPIGYLCNTTPQAISKQETENAPYMRLEHSTTVWGEKGAKFQVYLKHTDQKVVHYDRTSTYAYGYFIGL